MSHFCVNNLHAQKYIDTDFLTKGIMPIILQN